MTLEMPALGRPRRAKWARWVVLAGAVAACAAGAYYWRHHAPILHRMAGRLLLGTAMLAVMVVWALVMLGPLVPPALSVVGCWFGNMVGPGSPWLQVRATGVEIAGCRFGTPGAPATPPTPAIALLQGASGVHVTGNSFDSTQVGIELPLPLTSGVVIMGNDLRKCQVPIRHFAGSSLFFCVNA